MCNVLKMLWSSFQKHNARKDARKTKKKKKLKENETKQNKNSSKTQNPIISSQST
jgi:hypothetical protein